jgi:hypothetical protein
MRNQYLDPRTSWSVYVDGGIRHEVKPEEYSSKEAAQVAFANTYPDSVVVIK